MVKCEEGKEKGVRRVREQEWRSRGNIKVVRVCKMRRRMKEMEKVEGKAGSDQSHAPFYNFH